MSELKDGGSRITYSTGAQKEDTSFTDGKGAYHLLPPHPLRKVAEIYRKGAMKYTRWNDLPVITLQDTIGMISFCTCQNEKHFATQTEDMLLLVSARLVMQEIYEQGKNSKNINQPDLLYATQTEFTLLADFVINATKSDLKKRIIEEEVSQENLQTATHTFLFLLKECVETAMKKIFGKEIQNLLKDKEQTVESGTKIIKKKTEKDKKNIIDNLMLRIEKSCSEDETNYPNLVSLLKMQIKFLISKIAHVQSATESQKRGGWILTTTTQQTRREGFCVPTATKHLAYLEIIKKILKEHSPTCKILQHYKYETKTNQVQKFFQGSFNWTKGINLSRYVDSALRHMFQFLEGMEDEDHLHQALWNLMAISHTQEQIRRGELPEHLNDLPSYGQGEIQVHETCVCDKWRKDRRFINDDKEQ